MIEIGFVAVEPARQLLRFKNNRCQKQIFQIIFNDNLSLVVKYNQNTLFPSAIFSVAEETIVSVLEFWAWDENPPKFENVLFPNVNVGFEFSIDVPDVKENVFWGALGCSVLKKN